MSYIDHSSIDTPLDSLWTDTLDAIVPVRVDGFEFIEGDEAILVRGADGEAVTSLNDAAAVILALCDGTLTLRVLRELLLSRFPDEGDRIERDLIDLLARLNRHGLVVFSGAPVTDTIEPPEYARHTYHCNRGRSIAELLEARGWKRADAGEVAELAIWHQGEPDVRIARYQAYERFQTHELRCKRRLYQNLLAAGHSHITPATCVSAEEFRRRNAQDGDLWFLKLSSSTMSRDVACFRSNEKLLEAAARMEPRVYVIQRGVEDPMLIDGRKFTMRVYATLTSGRAYVHEKVRMLLQSAPYDPSSTDNDVQITNHRDCERRSSEGFAFFPQRFEEIKEIVRATFSCVREPFARVNDPHRFQIFGFDMIVSESLGTLLLEVNDWPNISTSGPMARDVDRHSLKTKVLEDTLQLVLEGEPGLYHRVL